ncbi:TPA: holo-[acyl-carrier-protein] synthase [candidate division WOR-3 bacterium]|jgi:holo-[acyl-carrier protein] synthase|uniref:Holo-[acyl-carrier-protein] synthase n=1 Tax=candidate division WOR-3 bacterium TaxID=2052148 RepID=A0A350H8K9_UNCW3|nr:holo-[acyl-carrier-protein] synthase [candidate division WOR-3 bacterium]
MNVSTGIDIIEVKRIKEKFSKDDNFMKLIFTPFEIEQVKDLEIKYIVLAGKWASKEAFSKAIGTGIGEELDWKDMEIRNDITGKPEIIVKESIVNKYKIKSLSLSISHVSEYAVASVVLLID